MEEYIIDGDGKAICDVLEDIKHDRYSRRDLLTNANDVNTTTDQEDLEILEKSEWMSMSSVLD